MSLDIRLRPKDAWSFFSANTERLSREQVEIASNDETDTSVCMTEDKGYPLFCVHSKGKMVYEEPALECDCQKTLRDIYIKYLFPVIVGESKKEERKPAPTYETVDECEQDPYDEYISQGGVLSRTIGSSGPPNVEDEITERDDELTMAVYDALNTILAVDPESMFGSGVNDIMLDMVDDIGVYLAEKYGISIYRPSWVETEEDDQTLTLVDYPYDEFIRSESEDMT